MTARRAAVSPRQPAVAFFGIYKELEPGKGTDVRSWQDRAAAEDVISQAWSRVQTQ